MKLATLLTSQEHKTYGDPIEQLGDLIQDLKQEQAD
jgi:hypothetical protein